MKKLIASLVAIMILVCGCTAAFAEQKALTGNILVRLSSRIHSRVSDGNNIRVFA
ncbi:MAG: hypothetical protein IJI09_07180 [Clostridia bacterium]|nr:hypothetical protein [Clostridia bacterium]